MLNCKQVTELASNSLDSTLPWIKRWQIKLHLLICKSCQCYIRQIRFIHQASQSMEQHWRKITLPKNTRQRILKKIKQNKDQLL